MFSKKSWSITGLDNSPEAIKAFQDAASGETLLLISQIAQKSVTRTRKLPTIGVNPFDSPRMDETNPGISDYDANLLANYAYNTVENRVITNDSFGRAFITFNQHLFAFGLHKFEFTDGVYGFHFVFNEYKDNSHAESMKEAAAYKELAKPYKFATGDDKKHVDSLVDAKVTISRKQVPVIVDFNTGKIFIESASKNVIADILDTLKVYFGIKSIAIGWHFADAHWPTLALAEILEGSSHTNLFIDRMNAAARAKGAAIEPLEDNYLENIVSNYFAFNTQHDGNSYTIGLSAPAKISLHGTPPLACATDTDATEILTRLDGSFVAQAELTLAHVEEIPDKKNGGMRKVTLPQFSFVFSPDSLAVVEVGAILLKNFDTPNFFKNTKRATRKQVFTIHQFWSAYYVELIRGMNALELVLLTVLGDDDNRDIYGIKPLRLEAAPASGVEELKIEPISRLAEPEPENDLVLQEG